MLANVARPLGPEIPVLEVCFMDLTNHDRKMNQEYSPYRKLSHSGKSGSGMKSVQISDVYDDYLYNSHGLVHKIDTPKLYKNL